MLNFEKLFRKPTMKYLKLPNDKVRRLTFYLAMEEHAAQLLKDDKSIDELFFSWRVRSTVVFGRNQLIDSEVNVAYCIVDRVFKHFRSTPLKNKLPCCFLMDTIKRGYVKMRNLIKQLNYLLTSAMRLPISVLSPIVIEKWHD